MPPVPPHQINFTVRPLHGDARRWRHDWERHVHSYRGPVLITITSSRPDVYGIGRVPIRIETNMTLDLGNHSPFAQPPPESEEVNGRPLEEGISSNESRRGVESSSEDSVQQLMPAPSRFRLPRTPTSDPIIPAVRASPVRARVPDREHDLDLARQGKRPCVVVSSDEEEDPSEDPATIPRDDPSEDH